MRPTTAIAYFPDHLAQVCACPENSPTGHSQSVQTVVKSLMIWDFGNMTEEQAKYGQ